MEGGREGSTAWGRLVSVTPTGALHKNKDELAGVPAVLPIS